MGMKGGGDRTRVGRSTVALYSVICNNALLTRKVMASNGLLNTKEAARFLRVSEASIRRWSDFGLLPAHRVGRRRERRFAHADLVLFLGQPKGQAPQAHSEVLSLNIGGASVPIRSHIAPIYSSDAGGLRLAVPFLADGIRAGQPCFLLATGPGLEPYDNAATETGRD